MTLMMLKPDSDILYQYHTLLLTVGEETKRVSLELRYLPRTDKWYTSLFDVQTGESYLRYVPLLASYDRINNLWEQFRHKNIGFFVCFPTVDNPSTEDPAKDNLNEFAIVWGDTLDE